MFCAAWIPWILLFGLRFSSDGSFKDAIGLVLAGALQILGGEPVTILETWLLAVACAAAVGIKRSGSSKAAIRRAGQTLGLLGASVGAAAVQVLPAIDLVHRSARARGFTGAEASYWSMPPLRPLEMLFAHLFGHAPLSPQGQFLSRLYPAEHSPFLSSLSIGSVAIVLVLAGLRMQRRGSILFLATCAGFYVVALGRHTPLFGWLHATPVFQTLRFPEKFGLGIALAGVVWAAILFDEVCRRSRAALRGALQVSAVLGSVSAVVWLALGSRGVDRWVAGLWDVRSPGELARLLTGASRDWLVAALTFSTIFAGLLFARTRPRAAVSILLIVAAAEFFASTRELAPRQPADFFTAPPAARQLRAQAGTYRIFHQADWHDTSPTAQLYFRKPAPIYWVLRNGMFPWTPAAWGYSLVLERDIDRTALLPTVDLIDSMIDVKKAGRRDWAEIFMRMSNAAYDAVYRPYPSEMSRIRGAWRDVAPIEFIGRPIPPRFSFANSLIRIRGRGDFVRRIVHGDARAGTAFIFSEPFMPAAGRVERVAEDPGNVAAKLRASGPAFLVIRITPDKDWSATLDGKPISLETVDVGYQGARIPAGLHRLEMRYRDPLVVAGAAVSVLTLLGLGLAAAVERRSSRGAERRL
jgi:hypothetical protein